MLDLIIKHGSWYIDKKFEKVDIGIKNSKIYVGTDSAFMHLSAALKVKSFGLYGDTPVNYAEYSDFIIPILPIGYETISHDSNAMEKISADHVYSQISDFI